MGLSVNGGSSIGGRAFSGAHVPSMTFPSGRKCAESDCETILSIYNDTNYCALHQPDPIGGGHWVRGRRHSEVA